MESCKGTQQLQRLQHSCLLSSTPASFHVSYGPIFGCWNELKYASTTRTFFTTAIFTECFENKLFSLSELTGQSRNVTSGTVNIDDCHNHITWVTHSQTDKQNHQEHSGMAFLPQTLLHRGDPVYSLTPGQTWFSARVATLSRASMSAPFANKAVTVSTWPPNAAHINGVQRPCFIPKVQAQQYQTITCSPAANTFNSNAMCSTTKFYICHTDGVFDVLKH